MNIVYVLLGVSATSVCNMPTFRNHVSVQSSKPGNRLCGVRKGKAIYTVAGNGTGASQASPHSLLPAFEDGTDTWFRNVGILHTDAGEIPKRTYTIFNMCN